MWHFRPSVRTGFFLIALFASLASGSASACPVCHSETGARVKAGIFDEKFGTNVFFTSLPFLIFGAIGAGLHFGWPSRPGKDR